MNIAIITVNNDGKKLARKLKADFPDAKIFSKEISQRKGLKNFIKGIFNRYEGFIFIAALGITVRLIDGFIKDKFHDPAVVSVDTAGRFSISVLSGHEGGANRLAFLAAASLGATPIITTGQEAHKKFILGIGTRRGVDACKVKELIKKAVKIKGITLEEVRLAATIELKKDESGLIEACRDLGLPLIFIPKETIGNFKSIELSSSEVVRRHIGLDGVCEPSALLAGRRARLVLRKKIQDGVTVAIAEEG